RKAGYDDRTLAVAATLRIGFHHNAGRCDHACDSIRRSLRLSPVHTGHRRLCLRPGLDGRCGGSWAEWRFDGLADAANCHEDAGLALFDLACYSNRQKRPAARGRADGEADRLPCRRLDALAQSQGLGDDDGGCRFFRCVDRKSHQTWNSARFDLLPNCSLLARRMVPSRADARASAENGMAVAGGQYLSCVPAGDFDHSDVERMKPDKRGWFDHGRLRQSHMAKVPARPRKPVSIGPSRLPSLKGALSRPAESSSSSLMAISARLLAATSIRRLAMLTVSPVAVICWRPPPPSREATMVPECAPILKPMRDATVSGSAESQPLIRSAKRMQQRAASAGSLGFGCGKPKRIIAPSPMKLVMAPPHAVTSSSTRL
ncbi:conserved hypothetical protein, partial [Ricinus communis]